jgi:RNA polymerase sigma-70 factor (ECF subfamily)
MVLATQGEGEEAHNALAALCTAYWRPVYSYIRGRGNSAEEAMDLTQEFFLRIIDKNTLATVRQEKGKFRTYLIVAINHFLTNEWDKKNALKRGGKNEFISFEEIEQFEKNGHNANHDLSPELIYERQWALSLLEAALVQLESEQLNDEQKMRFNGFRSFLTTDEERLPYEELSRKMEMNLGAVKTAVHRLRKQFALTIRQKVADSISDDSDVQLELTHLMDALSRRG